MGSWVADVESKLESKAAGFVKENRLPGASVGVIRGDDLAWAAGIGFAEVASRRTPDPATLYRVASITKTFTGTAIMQLRDEELLHLDDPAVKHVPELRDASSPFGEIEHVTIRRMLSHESGFVSEPPGTDWSTPSYEGVAERNLARVAEMGTRIPPNLQQKYSNVAYQLLGEIVARLSGTPYPEYVRANILEPLGMMGSGFDPVPEELLRRRATGYASRLFSDELDLASTDLTVWAEGGLWSSVDDLARWMSFQFREDGGVRDGSQVLAGSSLKEMHQARYLGDEAWTEAWCISWYAVRKDDVIWVQHSGGLHGFVTNICFDPKEKVGAIVLFNGVGEASDLAMELGKIARDAIKEAAPKIEQPAPTPEAFRPLLGLYIQLEFGELLRVEWRDGKLMVVDESNDKWRPILTPTANPDEFLIEPGVRESGELAVFRRLPDGRVASMFLAAGTYARLDPVS